MCLKARRDLASEAADLKLSAAVEETGVNYLMLRLAFGDMTLAEALRSLALFTQEVRPSLVAQERR